MNISIQYFPLFIVLMLLVSFFTVWLFGKLNPDDSEIENK